jgi:ABC-2 type transport system ATP-binding protein
MSEPAIDVRDLTKHFDGFVAVDGVTFRVDPGEIVGYLGPNGSGKTTTIRMLLGLLRPTAGEGRVLGRDIYRQAEAIRPLVGYMSQKFALYDDLTAAENLDFYAGVYGVAGRRRRIDELLGLLGLAALAGELAGRLSAGWRQRLALAVALVHRPGLLFLDEPTSGVDPSARRAFWERIYSLAELGTTVFVTTHYMDEAEYCHRIGIMLRGRLLALGTPAALKSELLSGPVWTVDVQPPLAALGAAESLPGVERASLAGDRLRLVTTPGAFDATSLAAAIARHGFRDATVEAAEPTLDDVFIALAGHHSGPAG